MKWYWYVFFVLLILVGIEEYRISKFHLEIHQLKDKIKELQNVPPPDTVKIVDTVIVEKPKKIKAFIPKETIDTLIKVNDHLIRVTKIDSGIIVDLICNRPEIIIREKIEVKTYIPELKEVIVEKHEPDLTVPVYAYLGGFVSGVGATLGIVYLATKLIK